MENKQAPDFALQDQDGKVHQLSDFKGHWLLLYFYPKDMTSGCTKEAEGFRDLYDKFAEKNVKVVGISCDSVESHKKFADKYALHFPLLADIEKKMVADYGVWVEKSMYGKKYMGIQRDSFLINPEGMITKHYVKVKAAQHPEQVLKDLEAGM